MRVELYTSQMREFVPGLISLARFLFSQAAVRCPFIPSPLINPPGPLAARTIPFSLRQACTPLEFAHVTGKKRLPRFLLKGALWGVIRMVPRLLTVRECLEALIFRIYAVTRTQNERFVHLHRVARAPAEVLDTSDRCRPPDFAFLYSLLHAGANRPCHRPGPSLAPSARFVKSHSASSFRHPKNGACHGIRHFQHHRFSCHSRSPQRLGVELGFSHTCRGCLLRRTRRISSAICAAASRVAKRRPDRWTGSRFGPSYCLVVCKKKTASFFVR